MKTTTTYFWKHCITNSVIPCFWKHHPALSNSQEMLSRRSASSRSLAHRWISVLFDRCCFVLGRPFGLKQMVSFGKKSRCWSSDSSLEIFLNTRDGCDKQPVAGAFSLWPSQVSKDSSTGLWLICMSTEVPCVTTVALNGANPWFHAIYNYNTQFCSELHRKENAKEEKELQLLRAAATQKRSGLGSGLTCSLQSFWKADRIQSALLGRRAGAQPWVGKDIQVSGWHGWSPLTCLTSTRQICCCWWEEERS